MAYRSVVAGFQGDYAPVNWNDKHMFMNVGTELGLLTGMFWSRDQVQYLPGQVLMGAANKLHSILVN